MLFEQYSDISYDIGRARCDILLNNICEVLNRRLVDARDQPIITCLQYIMEYLMRRIVIVQQVAEKTQGRLTPTATKIFERIKSHAGNYVVTWNGGNKYQCSRQHMDQYVVDMNEKSCTCRKWELTGFPCAHAVAAIWNMSINGMAVGVPEDFVDPAYRLSIWKDVYSHKINPISGRRLWRKSLCATTLLPPLVHKQSGRPKKKRRKSEAELESQPASSFVVAGKISRAGTSKMCSKCKQVGHNARGCGKRSASQGGPTGTQTGSVGGSQARESQTGSVGGSQARGTQTGSVGVSQPRRSTRNVQQV